MGGGQRPPWRDQAGSARRAIFRLPDHEWSGPALEAPRAGRRPQQFCKAGDYEGQQAFDDLCHRLRQKRLHLEPGLGTNPSCVEDSVTKDDLAEISVFEKDASPVPAQDPGASVERSLRPGFQLPKVNASTANPPLTDDLAHVLQEETRAVPPRKRCPRRKSNLLSLDRLPDLPLLPVADSWQIAVHHPRDCLAARPVVPDADAKHTGSSCTDQPRFRKGPALKKIWTQSRSISAKAAAHLDNVKDSRRGIAGFVPEANLRLT